MTSTFVMKKQFFINIDERGEHIVPFEEIKFYCQKEKTKQLYNQLKSRKVSATDVNNVTKYIKSAGISSVINKTEKRFYVAYFKCETGLNITPKKQKNQSSPRLQQKTQEMSLELIKESFIDSSVKNISTFTERNCYGISLIGFTKKVK